jgi:hypothetical protein
MTPPAAFTSTKIEDNDRYNNCNSRTIRNEQNNRTGAKLYLLGFPVFIGSFLGWVQKLGLRAEPRDKEVGRIPKNAYLQTLERKHRLYHRQGYTSEVVGLLGVCA